MRYVGYIIGKPSTGWIYGRNKSRRGLLQMEEVEEALPFLEDDLEVDVFVCTAAVWDGFNPDAPSAWVVKNRRAMTPAEASANDDDSENKSPRPACAKPF